MKIIKLSLIMVPTVALLVLSQGCALLLLGGAAAGAAYGTVEYVKNTLKVTAEVSLDKAWTAANSALKDLQMPVTNSAKDGATGRLEARNAKDQPVVIQLTRKTDTVTQIEITVGTFDSSDNRTEAQQIYDKMHAQF